MPLLHKVKVNRIFSLLTLSLLNKNKRFKPNKLIYIILCLMSDSDLCWAYIDYSLYIYREKTLLEKTL